MRPLLDLHYLLETRKEKQLPVEGLFMSAIGHASSIVDWNSISIVFDGVFCVNLHS